jgi:hypothetical protein
MLEQIVVQQTETLRVTWSNGELKLCNNLKDYTDWGNELEEMLLFDFLLNTYKGCPDRKNQVREQSRARNSHVPY